MAAVGTNGGITALLVSVSAGIAVGANVLIARLIGEKRNDRIAQTMHTAIAISVILGVIVGVIGQFISRTLLMFGALYFYKKCN